MSRPVLIKAPPATPSQVAKALGVSKSRREQLFKLLDDKHKGRKRRHWRVTVFYRDGERFVRVYADRAKAASFAERQKKSSIVKTTRVVPIAKT